MTSFHDFLHERLQAGGFTTEDALACFLPLLRQTAAAHQAGLVAPLQGTNDLHVENGRLWFEEGRRHEPKLQAQLVRQLEQPATKALEVVGEFHLSADVDGGGETVTSMRIGKRGDEIARPVYLPGY